MTENSKFAYDSCEVNAFFENCSVIYDRDTLDGAIIDPGGSPEKIRNLVDYHHVVPKFILITHGHLDHIGAAEAVSAMYGGIDIYGPGKADEFLLQTIAHQSEVLGLPAVKNFLPDRFVKSGDKFTVGSISVLVRECPGHTPGHVMYVIENENIVFSGDTVFRGSAGRTDFNGGSMEQLCESIRREFLTLPDETVIVPGHGDTTTVAEEKASHPYFLNLMV